MTRTTNPRRRSRQRSTTTGRSAGWLHHYPARGHHRQEADIPERQRWVEARIAEPGGSGSTAARELPEVPGANWGRSAGGACISAASTKLSKARRQLPAAARGSGKRQGVTPEVGGRDGAAAASSRVASGAAFWRRPRPEHPAEVESRARRRFTESEVGELAAQREQAANESRPPGARSQSSHEISLSWHQALLLPRWLRHVRPRRAASACRGTGRGSSRPGARASPGLQHARLP